MITHYKRLLDLIEPDIIHIVQVGGVGPHRPVPAVVDGACPTQPDGECLARGACIA